MLARANRITLGRDYKNVVRRGVRSVGPHTVTYVRRTASATTAVAARARTSSDASSAPVDPDGVAVSIDASAHADAPVTDGSTESAGSPVDPSVAGVNERAEPVRFGFIVAKNVGKAHDRNTVRRRLKAIGYEIVPTLAPGTDVVIRALPGIEDVEWSDLKNEVTTSMTRIGRRR